jgi:hypothetical protein
MTKTAIGTRDGRRVRAFASVSCAFEMGRNPEQSRQCALVLGAREAGTARLEEAVAAYRDALTEQTRERVPLDWAISFGNQGVALMRLAERTKDAAMAEMAFRQIEAALETLRAGARLLCPNDGARLRRMPADDQPITVMLDVMHPTGPRGRHVR